MSTPRIALLTAAFFTGLFAGLMVTFSVVIERTLVSLSAPEYTRVMQGLIRGADHPPVVPIIVVIGMLASLVALFHLRHDRRSPVFRLTLVGSIVFILGALVVTIGFNHPINDQIEKWSIQSPPDDWMALRDRWNQLNLIRTPSSVLAFLLFLLALARSGDSRPE